jgi:hypothetical protein
LVLVGEFKKNVTRQTWRALFHFGEFLFLSTRHFGECLKKMVSHTAKAFDMVGLKAFIKKTTFSITVTGIFLLSRGHSQRDQIYVFKILFNCTVTPSPNSVCTYGTRFSSTILYR